MTKKDFEKLARCYNHLLKDYAANGNIDCFCGASAAISQTCEVIKGLNPRFDVDRFLDACGLDEHRNTLHRLTQPVTP